MELSRFTPISTPPLSSSAATAAAAAESPLPQRILQLPSHHPLHVRFSSYTTTSRPFLKPIGFPLLVDRRSSIKVSCSSHDREIPVVHGSSMDEIYDVLAARLLRTVAVASNPDSKHIVGLAGPPGAGKSTVASEVVQRLNRLWPQKASSFDSRVNSPDVAAVIPMDGFHLYRFQLDAMEDPKEAHARRGAPWTFAPTLLLQSLKKLRNEGSVYAPSFDHGVGDPVEDGIFISLQHKVVIVEGNYLLLDDGVWQDVSNMFDERWFIEVDISTAMQRVLKRHISAGKPPDVAQWRIEYNDRPNAEFIMKSKKNADILIRSLDL